MLTYVASGERQFRTGWQPVHNRVNWEFMAVTAGWLGVQTEMRAQAEFRKQSLWVYPPSVAHGWVGKGEEVCQVVVIHFGSVPDLLARAAEAKRGLCVAIDGRERKRMTELCTLLWQNHQTPTDRSPILVQQAQLELSLIALKDEPVHKLSEQKDEHTRVAEAIAWYGEHLSDSPSLKALAKAMRTTEPQLRRMFHNTRGQSPRKAIESLRVERAQMLLRYGKLTIEEIAEACGFSEASALSRAFRRRLKVSPAEWRRGMLTLPAQ